ncbi:MAG: radical SAM protein [Candidatus Aenigmatarchaeota archaeon]
MRKISRTSGESFALGTLPKGCRPCIKGRKTVVFVTGICNLNCWYCSISKKRWQKDEVWANEARIKNTRQLISEIRKSGSTGAGMTGGEPLTRLARTARLIRILKKRFGKDFHLHLYTNGTIDGKALKKLYEAGLDEIRIHTNQELVKEALKFDWDVGMEVPVIPGRKKQLCRLADWLDAAGAKFLNLNELEFSERNVEPMKKLGMVLSSGSLTAVRGSRNTALSVLRYAAGNAKNLNVHFCTARLKLDHQLRNRLANRARNIKKPFEKVTKDGFLLKGVVLGTKKQTEKEMKRLKVPARMFSYNKLRKRMQTSEAIARSIARKTKLKVGVVEEYPIDDAWDFEFTPLN